MSDLSDLHLADLHSRAAEAGVSGYRMLGREELIAAIEGAGGGEPKRSRRRGRRGGRGRGGRERLSDDGPREQRSEAPASDDDETEEVTGILEITRQRHGFLSIEGSDDDVYVSASQVRRCELNDGDEVTGPVRAPRRGERHRALVRVNLVNGEEPVEAPARKRAGGGDARARSGSSAAPRTVELALVSVEGERCVIELDGTEHTLEPGDRVNVSLDEENQGR